MVQRYVVIEEMDCSLVTEKELIPRFVTRGRCARRRSLRRISFRKVKSGTTPWRRDLEISTMRAASSSPWTFYGVIRRQGSLVRG